MSFPMLFTNVISNSVRIIAQIKKKDLLCFSIACARVVSEKKIIVLTKYNFASCSGKKKKSYSREVLLFLPIVTK